MNLQIKNEKGITLVELLAAISLFTILIALSGALIFQMTKSEAKTSGKVTLSQETNILISDLKNQFYNGKTRICLNNDEIDLEINEEKSIFLNGDNQLEVESACLMNVDNTKPLEIQLTTEKNAEQLTIKTTWNNRTNYVMDLSYTNPHDFDDGNMNDNEQCDFNSDTKFMDTRLGNKQNEPCANEYIINGSAAFMEDLIIGNKVLLTVNGDLYLFGNLDFNGSKGTICVKGKVFPEEILDQSFVNQDADTCEITKKFSILIVNQ